MTNKPSILIVDDNESLRKTMSFIFVREGYEVSTANDGPEAIKLVKESPFDIVFMDIKMPLMDGVETYKRAKAINPDMVVIMMTAYAVEDLIQEALKEGAYGVIYKPLDMEKVFSLVQEAMETKKPALIMVVDDDPGTCATLKNVLVGRGYRVSIASTGEEAISLAKENNHDIIFIDLKLPTINGLETFLTIKQHNPEAVAIMITGYRQEMSDLVEQALNKSAYACLYKPLDMDEVLRLVGEILRKKQNK